MIKAMHVLQPFCVVCGTQNAHENVWRNRTLSLSYQIIPNLTFVVGWN